MNDAGKFENLLIQLDIHNEDAARILGVHRTTLFRWLAGTARVPKMAMMVLELMKKNQSSSG